MVWTAALVTMPDVNKFRAFSTAQDANVAIVSNIHQINDIRDDDDSMMSRKWP
jgi:hypothetical protein